MPSPVPAPVDGQAPVVALAGVVKRYGKVQALSGLDLSLAPGQVYGFLGRNGAGKSTTLRIVMGISQPTSGHVAIFGRALSGDDPAVRRRIGYVAQEQTFYGWMTALRLAGFVGAFYPTWDQAEFSRLLRLLDVPSDRRIQTFSGGMHAKLALALALAHRPELLILDEPTAAMDAVTRREFLELVREQSLRAGRTTLFSSHLIDEVELAADTVGIVDGGRMRFQGPRADLQQRTRQLRFSGPDAAQAPLPPALQPGSEPGLSVLEDRREVDQRRVIAWADRPALFDALAAEPAGWHIAVPALEDIFVAMVRRQPTSGEAR